MSHATEFGVQSYCFRNFKDNAVVAEMVKEIGLNSIEVCAVHADFSDLDSWKEIVEIYRNAGVSIISIGVQTFTGDERERVWFECAAAAGAKHISAHFKIDSYQSAIPKVREWCREFGIKVGIHCHGGYMFGGSPDVLDFLLEMGGPEIGLCIDTAWAMQIGPKHGKPVDWVQRFSKKIVGVHYKDFVFGRDGQWTDVIVGEGNLPLKSFVEALNADGFSGMAVIEFEGDVEAPVPSLKKCVESMRANC